MTPEGWGVAVPAACAGVAAWLVCAPASALPRARRPSGVRGPGAVLVIAAAVALVVLLEGRLLVLGLVLTGGAVGAHHLWLRQQERRAVETRRAAVSEMCDVLAAELQAGQPPGVALARAARDWPELDAVAQAQAFGADVPSAWRMLAARPGCGDLRLVAAAWQVSQHSGAGLAEAVTRVASLARATESTRRVVASELASARATARLMAGLPVLALAMGTGIGGNPWSFLFLTTPGLVCLALGVVLGLTGLWWIEAIAAGVTEGAG